MASSFITIIYNNYPNRAIDCVLNSWHILQRHQPQPKTNDEKKTSSGTRVIHAHLTCNNVCNIVRKIMIQWCRLICIVGTNWKQAWITLFCPFCNLTHKLVLLCQTTHSCRVRQLGKKKSKRGWISWDFRKLLCKYIK